VDLSDGVASVRNDIAEVELHDQLGRAFDLLSQDHRVVIVLHHLIGLPLGEIAEILDIPYGTVGSRLHHAMQAMRASIDAAERASVAGGQPA
jgi:RNA polymerase sigma-70 factor (ECF subfamily)